MIKKIGKENYIMRINYIYSNILSWNIIENTHLATWGLEPSCIYIPSSISPKKDASSPQLSNTAFSHSSNVNSHIMTDAIFVM